MNVLYGERYRIVPDEVEKYVLGYYGALLAPVDPRAKASSRRFRQCVLRKSPAPQSAIVDLVARLAQRRRPGRIRPRPAAGHDRLAPVPS